MPLTPVERPASDTFELFSWASPDEWKRSASESNVLPIYSNKINKNWIQISPYINLLFRFLSITAALSLDLIFLLSTRNPTLIKW